MLKGEKTRGRIVSKAAQLFNERGLEGTSLADLMEATGLEKGGIYRHFPSKEAVATEAFDYAWQSAFAARMHDLDTISNSVDKLKQFVTNFVERRPSVPGGCPLLNTAVAADDGNPVLRARARHYGNGVIFSARSSIPASSGRRSGAGSIQEGWRF